MYICTHMKLQKQRLQFEMSTAQGRKQLSERNQALRAQYNALKEKKDDLQQHINTLDRRIKQMTALKLSLTHELQKSQNEAKITRNKKIAYIGFLKDDILRVETQLGSEQIRMKNLQAEYDVCLKDYDNIVKMVTIQIEKVKLIETQILKEKKSDADMKAMIFDYERLKRVLQEERKYFRELNISEQKSHEERIKELKIIRDRLTKEESASGGNHKLSKFRIGLTKIHSLYRRKFKEYGQIFLIREIKEGYKTELGIRTFKNCIQLGNLKHRQSLRRLFSRWHHNIFPKSILNNLVENTLTNDLESRRKIVTMNKMIEKVNEDNLSLFHLYEKMRFLMVIANKASRKDAHYGFTKWRNNYHHKTQTYNNLLRIFNKTIPTYEKRTSFRVWKENSYVNTRIERANALLNQFLQVKELSRVFRKWRFQCNSEDLKMINNYIFNIKLRNKISSRISYEKRKTKAITTLAFKMTKIKLRNYFTKYWRNVKYFKVHSMREQIQDNREQFSQLRVQHKNVTGTLKAKDQEFSLKAFRSFMMNMKLKPVMKKWRNSVKLMKRRSQVLLHIALKRQARSKMHVMNEFRQCVQYHEKKEMHQVLTDLNNKMETINEKSTIFRERLKKCVQDLGVMASKKISSTYNYSVKCQTRVYFDQDLRLRVRQLYYHYILNRLDVILNNYCQKNTLNEIKVYCKDKKRDQMYEQRLEKYIQNQNNDIKSNVFYYFKRKFDSRKQCFKNMTQTQNVLIFYRMASAFAAVERKGFYKKVQSKKKEIVSCQQALKARQENLQSLGSQKQKLEESLKKIFGNFVNFENRNMKLKEKRLIEVQTKRYFKRYRENVREQLYMQKVLTHFLSFLNQKNNFIFWKGITAIRYEKMIQMVKEELTKINKKKKAFQEKSDKGRGDLIRKMQEEEQVHGEHEEYYQYYLNKFESTIKFYVNKHERQQKSTYMKQIFRVWKKEYQGAKKLGLGINKVLQRNLVYNAYYQVVKMLKKMDSQLKSQYLCADIMLRKGKNCLKDCLILWRANMRKIECEKMQKKGNEIMQKKEVMKDDCREKAYFISEQVIRVNKRKLLIKCFMAFKNEVTDRKNEENKIKPLQEQIGKRIVRTAVKGLKWLMFYKKTKRSYLKYKKSKLDGELKRDVFNALKIYRQEHYYFVDRVNLFVETINQQYLRFSMDKLINVGAYERDQLNYERRRALRHLVMNKVGRVQIIKKKIMCKWHAWLIPRTHYLPNVMKQLQVRALRRYFGNIRQHSYWNQYYIKNAADKVTSQGYGEVNSATNNLIKEGYDPDEIKQFLTKKNENDSKTIKKVVNHVKEWGKREDMVRAFHSWQQYCEVKQKIKKSLSKVLNIAQGLGRYWNRWKSKDPIFNAILEKQSRGNMLSRYEDLARLLKEYKRDIRDSKVYCDELKEINGEYREKNEEGIKMALSTLSGNIKVSLRQGMNIWRGRVRQIHRGQMDERYEQLSQGIQLLHDQKSKLRYRLAILREQNTQLKQKCNLGAECGKILEKLLTQRDNLSIDLADKEHNMKLLLEDNLRLKQKIRAAQMNAEKLINKVQNARDQQQ